MLEKNVTLDLFSHYIPTLFPNVFSLNQIWKCTQCTLKQWEKDMAEVLFNEE